ncbi:uncharacterized protein L203_100995 [Cryptococcus depauperatus CBS 7841]|uniref:Uncharacterized protein n=1 Tax=Cryptococcus depauperatus CBS 7841 TaxID=1295531 RepID=A0A1E3I968_9TREE|nr:cytoplasmic protein [Cryptococcus depauperatus CBS 7841]
MVEQLVKAKGLLKWLQSNGGYFHPSAKLQIDDTTGLSIFAAKPIGPNERLVSCPFDLAVTPETATRAICQVAGLEEENLVWPMGTLGKGEPWNERMRIGAYLGLHWVYQDQTTVEWPSALIHKTYLNSLPDPSTTLMPLYYNPCELELLTGSNLYGAVKDRQKEWFEESAVLRTVLKEDGLTWERYLATSTYMSSRAFPSRLLRLSMEEQSTHQLHKENEVSHPVLLPGVDIFNHARGQPIIWLCSVMAPSPASHPLPCISLVSSSVSDVNTQVFNNYGVKPNEELLLGYGFVLDNNPDDVVVLRLGADGLSPAISKRLEAKNLNIGERFELRRDGEIDRRLLEVMRVMLGEEEEEMDENDEHAMHKKEEKEMKLELDVLETLGGMLEDKLGKLEAGGKLSVDGQVRDQVKKMVSIYRKGQIDILNSAMDTLSERIERVESLIGEGMGECSCCCP